MEKPEDLPNIIGRWEVVLAGIAALCLSIALKYQPGATQFFVDVSTAYLKYGRYPNESSGVVLAKWCLVLAIAIWLSVAQLAAWVRSKKTDIAAQVTNPGGI
jgi:hypothetical protein